MRERRRLVLKKNRRRERCGVRRSPSPKSQIEAQRSGFDLEKEEQRNERTLIFYHGHKKT